MADPNVLEYEALLDRVEVIFARSTEGLVDDEEYKELRQQVLDDPLLQGHCPRLFKACSDAQDLWTRMKTISAASRAKYDARRAHIGADLQPLRNRIKLMKNDTTSPSGQIDVGPLGAITLDQTERGRAAPEPPMRQDTRQVAAKDDDMERLVFISHQTTQRDFAGLLAEVIYRHCHVGLTFADQPASEGPMCRAKPVAVVKSEVSYRGHRV